MGKKEIAKRIVSRISNSGGRFLKRSSDSIVWSEVIEKKALEKTLQALREGLDVRNSTVRPAKLFSDVDATNPRKRARLVEGLVMNCPNKQHTTNGTEEDVSTPDKQHTTNGVSAPKKQHTTNRTEEGVPELVQDQQSSTLTFEPIFSFSECENI